MNIKIKEAYKITIRHINKNNFMSYNYTYSKLIKQRKYIECCKKKRTSHVGRHDYQNNTRIFNRELTNQMAWTYVLQVFLKNARPNYCISHN